MCRALENQLQLGTSKRADERAHAGRAAYIHSAGTMRTYIQHARQYGDYLRNHGLNHATMAEAQEHAHEYIKSQSSTWSQHAARSALARVFGVDGRCLCELEGRNRHAITRGRDQTARADAIDRNHADLAEIGRSCGARHSELERLRCEDIHERDGDLYVHIRGKGGKERDALILPGRGRELIARAVETRGRGCIVDRVPSGANVHAWRADYAARCYNYALQHGKSSGEKYQPRDGSKTTWDKGALAFVSENLGHGEDRCYTVYTNYLSYGRSDK